MVGQVPLTHFVQVRILVAQPESRRSGIEIPDADSNLGFFLAARFYQSRDPAARKLNGFWILQETPQQARASKVQKQGSLKGKSLLFRISLEDGRSSGAEKRAP
jgi:hypothetical protein